MWVGDELTCMRFNVSGNILLRRLNILAFLLCAPNCRQEEKKKKEKKKGPRFKGSLFAGPDDKRAI